MFVIVPGYQDHASISSDNQFYMLQVATMFAVMKDTEYASKETFTNNFFADWQKILGETHIIKKFEFCDFTPIYEWHLQEKEKKKQITPEVIFYAKALHVLLILQNGTLVRIYCCDL